jgi:hypothetical protein
MSAAEGDLSLSDLIPVDNGVGIYVPTKSAIVSSYLSLSGFAQYIFVLLPMVISASFSRILKGRPIYALGNVIGTEFHSQ